MSWLQLANRVKADRKQTTSHIRATNLGAKTANFIDEKKIYDDKIIAKIWK